MKLLLLLVVALVAVWAWRSGRSSGDAPRAGKPPPPPQPQDMVRCEACGIHLPKADAVAGRRGWYCCAEHQQRTES